MRRAPRRTAQRVSGATALLLLLLGPGGAPRAGANTLIVGPDQQLKTPSAAAAIAADGDVIEIEPLDGGYFDCAVWRSNHLIIEGQGLGAVVTDTACQGKGLFIIAGNDITIRNLTFERARVPDKNGAGIRAEGRNLRVEHSRFINNESGILASSMPGSTIVVLDSQFIDDGKCDPKCSAGVAVDPIDLLHVEGTVFRDSKGGTDIRSSAMRTELIGNEISDGEGASDYLVEVPDGGSLVMHDNRLERGPRSLGRRSAVTIMAAGGSHPVNELTFTGNSFRNDTGTNVVFVQNWSGETAHFGKNTVNERTVPLSSDGYEWFRIKALVRETIASARESLSSAKSSAKSLLKRVL